MSTGEVAGRGDGDEQPVRGRSKWRKSMGRSPPGSRRGFGARARRPCHRLEVTVAGAGDVTLGGVAQSLKASIIGSGDVRVGRVTGPVTKR